MGVRDAKAADLDALLALEAVCYPPDEAYAREQYRQALHARAVNLVFEDDGRIVGFIGAFHHKRWRAGHVFTINVAPEARRRGVATALLRACEARLARLGMRIVVLEVNVGNEAAIALYERLGYARGERIPDYYVAYPDNDAWRYAKTLAPAREATADA